VRFNYVIVLIEISDRTAGVRLPAEARDFSLLYSVQPDSRAHPTSYPKGIEGSFSRGKAARARS
jgi:hypothetical protein